MSFTSCSNTPNPPGETGEMICKRLKQRRSQTMGINKSKLSTKILRVIPTLTKYFVIVSDILSGSIYGIIAWHSILAFYRAFDLTFFSGIQSSIYADILSGTLSDIYFDICFLHVFCFFLAYVLAFYMTIYSGIYSGIQSGILSGIQSDILFWHSTLAFYLAYVLTFLSGILPGIYSGFFSGWLSGIYSDFHLVFYSLHSIWHLFWHSFSHSNLAFYLASILTL